jgi:putative membrane-bound dehydrogenase-like protein
MSHRPARVRRDPQAFLRALAGCFLLVAGWIDCRAEEGRLQAGIALKNITPTEFPVWVNGGIAAVQADKATDPLNARCLVLSDGQREVAICVVDNCILPVELVDEARRLASQMAGIAPSHILISATHTHSAVAVAGAHGTPVQEDYAAKLPLWIAEGIAQAKQGLVDAKIGWGSTIAEKYIHCRRWLMRPGSLEPTPFTGRDGDEVVMNPGHDNPNKIAPVGPIDRTIPILSVQSSDGKPLAILASFSTHYAGSPALSADYFGVVARRLAQSLRPEAVDQFLGIMANGTSGDANCIDFSKPPAPFTHVDVGDYVAGRILEAIPKIEHTARGRIDALLETETVGVRMPRSEEVEEAKRYQATHFPDRLPKTLVENYARETILLSELPDTRPLRCQAIQIGSGVILANPCESYGETGLKLRQASPFDMTMNIGLANGHAGYIPPPEHFLLGGYTTWRARSSCLEEQAEPKMVSLLASLANRLHQDSVASVKSAPNRSPIAPEDSIGQMEWESNQLVDLVAHEPEIADPVAIQFDDAGRMWAIEMGDYPNGPKEGESPKGRLVVLEDRDGDGRFESSAVFADQLLFATGLQLWKDGALVTMAGSLVWLRDTDGDGRCDQRETWIDGFKQENPQLRANDPTLGPDGWIYIANGLRGGRLQQPGAASDPVELQQHDLRLNPRTQRIQMVTGPAQFGLTWDRLGNRYHCANRQPCREAMVEPHQLALSPLAGLVPSVMDASPSEASSSVRPLVRAWTTSNLHAGQFTAACGVLVSHSDQLAPAWGHVLTCEPTGSLVQRRSLKRADGRSVVADAAPQREFLASRDPWFRPVNLTEGPGGEIFVVDMYRAVIEHPDWVPVEQKQRPDERFGEGLGRIYRISGRDRPASTIWSAIRKQPMRQWTTEKLVETLARPEAWARATALRLLIEKPDNQQAEILATFQRILEYRDESSLHMAALTWLATREAWDDTIWRRTLQSHDAGLQRHAMHLLADGIHPRGIEGDLHAIGPMLDSNDRDLLRSVCWAIARTPEESDAIRRFQLEKMLPTLARQSLACPTDGHLQMAIAAAVRNHPVEWMQSWGDHWRQHSGAATNSTQIPTILQQSVRHWMRAAALQSPDTMQRAIDGWIPPESWDRMTEETQRLHLALWSGWRDAAKDGDVASLVALKRFLAKTADNQSASADLRAGSLMLLRSLDPSEAKSVALELLEEPSGPLLKAVLSAATFDPSEETQRRLVGAFAKATPELRLDYFQVIRASPERLALLLERLESGEISSKLLDASQRESLLGKSDLAEKDRWVQILGPQGDPDRQAIIDRYRQAFGGSWDVAQGQRVFRQQCAGCHRIDQFGTAVGPDISDSREQSFDKLLISILDPNRTIDGAYYRYVVALDSGEVLEGLLQEATPEVVTIKSQNGTIHRLMREEIESFQSTGNSLMPVGIEQQVGPKEMWDLLAYIKNWRYLQEGLPIQATPTATAAP